jgi:RHS repeat-associated protein
MRTTRGFDGVGNPLKITDVMGLSITAEYNNFGHRLNVTDPDRGRWFFTYNGFGEVKTQTDARNKQTTLTYDKLGRVISRNWYESSRTNLIAPSFIETTEYENVGSTNYGTVKKVTRSGGAVNSTDFEKWERQFTYDALSRAKETGTTMQAGLSPALTLTTQTKFDSNFGRTKQLVYPASALDGQPVSIYQAYNNIGALVKEGFAADYVGTAPESSPAIRKLNNVDGRGLVIWESYGVDATEQVDWRTRNVFDSSGWLLAQCVNKSGLCSEAMPTVTSDQPMDERYRFDIYGNLRKQFHNGKWQLASSVGTGSVTYQYDVLHRLTQAVRTGPSGPETVNYAYDAIGGLLKKSDYSLDSTGAYSYFGTTHKVQSVALKAGGTASYDYDPNGNVKSRTDSTGMTALQYDIANLPVRFGQNTSKTVNYSYDFIGGLKSKSDYATNYVYDNTKHRVTSVALAPEVVNNQTGRTATYSYDLNGNVDSRNEDGVLTTLQYDIANLPRKIVKNTTTADFYEAQGGRYLHRMTAGGMNRDTYSLEKTYEREVVGGAISIERYYLTSDSLLTIKAEGRKLNYMHTDRLGSPVSITEKPLPANGTLGTVAPTLVEHKGFDAFGKALDGQWGLSNLGMLNLQAGQALNTGKRNQRGFTGHEHLDEFALIHMNGRAYDYNLGRFYGVDPVIQFPGNSQSLNPYSYLMNNPLAGTDPTGYVVWFAPVVSYVGGAIGLWGAAETGTAIGNTINEVSAGERSAGDVIAERATEIVIDRATDAVGGKVLKVADAVIPNSVKQGAIDAVTAVGKKIGLGSVDVPVGNGAQTQAPGTQATPQSPEKIGGAQSRKSPTEMTGSELQSATDKIHSQKTEIAQRMAPTTVTVTRSGKAIVSSANGVPPPAARKIAREELGDDTSFVRGGKSGNAPGDTGHHSEQRGINAAGGEAAGSRQASSHFACEGCAAAQKAAGVENITGSASDNGGKIGRPLSCDHEKKDC